MNHQRIFRVAALFAALMAAALPARAATPGCPALLDRQLPRLQDEKPQNLCQYAGKVVLVVNTASFCGFTPQYKSLEALHAKYRERGLVVLGFPSNEFGNQEPGSNKEIAEFCENTFSVRFPMFAKTAVAARPGQSPLFAELTQATGKAPEWNFTKYLIGRDGKPAAHFPSKVDPLDRTVVQAVEKLLDAK